MATDFSFKPTVDVNGIARLAQEQAQKQAALDQQYKQGEANNILAAAKAASDMVSASVEASKQRQMMQNRKLFAESIANQVKPLLVTPMGPPQMTQGLISQPMPMQPVETPDYNTQNAVKASIMANPEPWYKEYSNMVLQSPLEQAKTKLDLSRNQALSGPVTPATQTLIQQFHDKIGKPAPDTSMMTEEQAQTYLGHAKSLLPANSHLSPYAEVRKMALLDKMNKDMAKTMQPSNWTGNGPAALSARLVVNAESAKVLANQIIKGEVPASRQAMSMLNADAARVVAQQGVITNEGRHELTNSTGYADFAKALEYFTNHPEDQKAGEFVKVLAKEMGRQQELRQRIVDRTMRSNLAAHQEFRKLDPDAWANGLEENGIDAEAAKKGHFKLKKDYLASLQPEGGDSLSGGLTPAEAAELADLEKKYGKGS